MGDETLTLTLEAAKALVKSLEEQAAENPSPELLTQMGKAQLILTNLQYADPRYLGEYVVKRWSYREKLRFEGKWMRKLERATGLPKDEKEYEGYLLDLLLSGLKKAPFELTLENIAGMDGFIADLLRQTVTRNNYTTQLANF